MAGLDVEALLNERAGRLLAILHAMIVEAVSWASEDDRKVVMDLLEWPDVAEARDLAESDRQARAALESLGVPFPQVALPA